MTNQLRSKTSRAALPARKEPHYEKISTGLSLGFYKSETGAETWKARKYDGRRYTFGKIDGLPSEVSFDEAAVQARAWAKSGVRGKVSVEKLLAEAVADLLKRKPHSRAAHRAELIFKNCPADIAAMEFVKLNAAAVTALQDSIISRGLKPQSVNREMTVYRSAFTFGFRMEYCETDSAWSGKRVPSLQFAEGDSGRREIYLTPAQRSHLFSVMPYDLNIFCQGLELTGARMGELASATVADLISTHDGLSLRLASRKGATGRLRERYVELDEKRASFFKNQARSKLPAAPLFQRKDGLSWTDSAKNHGHWIKPFKAAVAAAWPDSDKTFTRDERDGITAYVLRHCTITDMIRSGFPVDLTADVCGTSAVMIAANYKQHIPNSVRSAWVAVATSANLGE